MKTSMWSRKLIAASVLGSLTALGGCAMGGREDAGFETSRVHANAPARTGDATVPSGWGNRPMGAVGNAYPPNAVPSGVSPSAPAVTGQAATPTHGPGDSAPPPRTEPMGRLPETPSFVHGNAPARTGPATVPTNVRLWELADVNRDGRVDRAEFDAFLDKQGWLERR